MDQKVLIIVLITDLGMVMVVMPGIIQVPVAVTLFLIHHYYLPVTHFILWMIKTKDRSSFGQKAEANIW
ncbi:hypothetical protein NG99_02525 [Erwinia typographi]|uniref:Uncharacterized protein n=1 Tax=Erwinia typographi TaxID=371042 RepID=A0A0A3Z9S0_9GAMM|nr:hypothetical protein NG99_02525 [Erwinia typographi]